MRATLLAVKKDVRQIVRDPAALAAWLAMPALMMALIAAIFGVDSGPAPQGKLLVADQDGTLASKMLLAAFDSDSLRKLVTVEKVGYEDGRRRVDRGDGAGLLVIPKGLANDYLSGKPAALTLVTNPEYRILPQVIEEVLEIELDGAFYLDQIAGAQVRRYRNGLPPGFAGERGIADDLAAVRRIARYLDPPLIDFRYNEPPPREKPRPFSAAFYPGMLMLAVFGFAQAMSDRLWRERAAGTLRRWLTASQPVSAWLAGKLLAQVLVFLVLAASVLATVGPWVSAPPHNFWMATAWCALCGVGLFLMAGAIQLSAPDQRAGAVLNFFVLFVFSMAGGTFFPFEMMPRWLAAIGRMTPNGWAVWRLREMLDGPVDPGRALSGLAMALVFCGVLFFILARRLRRWAV